MSANNQSQTVSAVPQFQWQWNWKTLLFLLIFFPITVRLCFWQIARAEEKQQILDEYQRRGAEQAMDFTQASQLKDKLYVRVAVQGHYDNETTLLLDNKVRHGKPGYEVVSPFQMASGETILVNRGWVAGSMDRTVLPQIEPVKGTVALTGYFYQSPGKQVMLGEDVWDNQPGPIVVQSAAPEHVSAKLKKPFYPYQLRLDSEQRGGYETGWKIINVKPGMHKGYAFQWGMLAATLVILSLFASSNLGEVLRAWCDKKRVDKSPQ